ncbi:hypothetical protein KIPB_007158 [Kipferlia bialata]|uniref:Lipid-binding serum glycoprotein C-terminal domain-containing protein n=1 Tax=Kipferlia bialata TaxID=797122 RepID=A0A9K3CYA7_9EUKA|nr:hypothetical protein KIPB_007158 [Kipferlia bialata]|eukprot:g7158.t1
MVHDYIPELEQTAYRIKFNDIHEVLDLKITEVDLDITSMAIDTLTIGDMSSSTSMEGTPSFIFSVNSLAISIGFNWAYAETSWPFSQAEGTGIASVSDATGDFDMLFSIDDECGCTHLDILSVNLDFDVDIELHGDGSALFETILNALVDMLEDMFEESFEEMLRSGMEDSLNDIFYHRNHSNKMPDGMIQDDRLCGTGIYIGDSFITFRLSMYIYPAGEDEAWPERGTPTPLPTSVVNADMQMIYSNNVFNSMYRAEQDLGMLHGTISPSTVTDPSMRSLLSTDVLASICPGLYNAYPDAEVELSLASTQAPELSFLPSAGYLNVTGTVDISVSDDPDPSPALTLGVSYGLALQSKLVEILHSYGNVTFLSWETSVFNVTAWPVSSRYGDVSTHTPQAMELSFMLGSFGVAPWFESFSDVHAPNFNYPDGFLTYDDIQIMYPDSETMLLSCPMW